MSHCVLLRKTTVGDVVVVIVPSMLVRGTQYTDGRAVTLPILIIELLILLRDNLWSCSLYASVYLCVRNVCSQVYTVFLTEICLLGSIIHFYLNMEVTDMCPATIYSVTLSVAYVLAVNA